MRGIVAVLGAGLLLGAAANAADDAPIHIPESYLIGRSPVPLGRPAVPKAPKDGVERPKAIDGYFWAEIFPIYNEGFSGNTSYIRLGSGATTSTFRILAVGTPSGTTYGDGTIQVAAKATRQFPIGDVLTTIGAGALTGGDTAYSIYLSNTSSESYYQHVIFNGTNFFYEDVTICPSGASLQGNRTVHSLHSTLLSGYGFPGKVYLHNLVEATASYNVRVYDARTGTLLGTVSNLTAQPNATYAIDASYFENQIGFTPNSDQQHLNLEFHATTAFAAVLGVAPDPADVGAIFGAGTINAQYNAVLNLSNKCSVNR